MNETLIMFNETFYRQNKSFYDLYDESSHDGTSSLSYDTLLNENDTYIINCSLTASPFKSEYFRGAIYFLYALVFVVSLIGNGIVCYIVIATPRMRTVTNYFIANLAIGDMLITIMCVPFTSISQVQQYWPFYNFLCPVVPYVQAVSVFVSTYTLVAISVDRYVAIMWPLKPRLAKKTSAFVILTVWLFATITVLPIPIVTKATQPADWYIECDIYMCQEDWSAVGLHYAPKYSKVLLILQFVVPVSVLLFTYTSIGIVIWCHRIPGEAENCRDQRIAKSKRKMIKMMVAVVVVYTVCWLPLNMYWIIIRWLFLFIPLPICHASFNVIMHDMGITMNHEEVYWFSSHWFAMSHPCYNPIIYCYMNSRFRQGFANIFGIVPCLRRYCATTAIMNINGRSRMSFPLTSIGATDSTILHRNNTCTTYISTRRRNGNSMMVKNSTKVVANNANQHVNFAPLNENTTSSSSSILYCNRMPPVRSLSVMRTNNTTSSSSANLLGGMHRDANAESGNNIELMNVSNMQITRRSTRGIKKCDNSDTSASFHSIENETEFIAGN